MVAAPPASACWLSSARARADGGSGASSIRSPCMLLAADYPFLNILWTMIIFFAWVVWIWMMIVILTDVFRRRDISGWGKALWVIFLIILPFIGVLAYLITQHNGMAERGAEQARAQR